MLLPQNARFFSNLLGYIACFSLRTTFLFMAESTDFLKFAVFYGKSRFLDESTEFLVLSPATTPPPPDFRLAALRARRVYFFGYYPKSHDFSGFRLGNPDVPRTYVPRYLCSSVPMFPEPTFPGTYVPQSYVLGTYVSRFTAHLLDVLIGK